MTKWVLRSAIDSRIIGVEENRPSDAGFPVIIEGEEFYWIEEDCSPLPEGVLFPGEGL